MKRLKLIKTIEEMGCILSVMVVTTIGIKILKQVLISRFQDITISMKFLPNISLRNFGIFELTFLKRIPVII